MGTRADFYLGRGADAQWLGSIAWDGYPSGIVSEFDEDVLNSTKAEDFSALVHAKLLKRDDGTTPEMGWPWPWDSSNTTDYAYAFDEGKVWASSFGAAWFDVAAFLAAGEPEDFPAGAIAEHPDMSAKKNVNFGARSGLVVVGR